MIEWRFPSGRDFEILVEALIDRNDTDRKPPGQMTILQ